jgi:hypothetical protein
MLGDTTGMVEIFLKLWWNLFVGNGKETTEGNTCIWDLSAAIALLSWDSLRGGRAELC